MSIEHSPERQRLERRSRVRPPLPRVALTISEFAATTGISKASLYRMMLAGTLRYAQIGATRRIPVSEYTRLGLIVEEGHERRPSDGRAYVSCFHQTW